MSSRQLWPPWRRLAAPHLPLRLRRTRCFISRRARQAAKVEHIASLLSYDEAVLRAEGTKMWLSRSRAADEPILERIFADNHPLVARRVLGGTIAGFSRCRPRRQARLIAGLLSMAARTGQRGAVLAAACVVRPRPCDAGGTSLADIRSANAGGPGGPTDQRPVHRGTASQRHARGRVPCFPRKR